MPRPKAAPVQKDSPAELLRVPQRFAIRTSMYLQQLGDLAAQGSVDPRDYIEQSLALWSGALDDLADSLSPAPQSDFGALFPIPVVASRIRRERADIPLRLSSEIFDRFGGNEAISLSIDGLIRRRTSKRDLRPAMTLTPDQNLRIAPDKITRAQRSRAELKVFQLSPAISSNDIFEGIVWGARESPRGAGARARNDKFPVAVVVLTIA